MKQIILKCRLSDRGRFEDQLADKNLDFGPIYWQHDRIYVPRGYRPSQNYPRLIMRTDLRAIDEPPIYFLILRRHIEDSGVDIVEQTPVIDYAVTANIIMQLGFRQAAEVSRRRQDLVIGEGTTLYLDDIDGKDETYAKIETTLTPSDSVEAVRTRLTNFLSTLKETNITNRPYFEL
ncbi:hypothetical protein IJ135_02885 [Candidatus Saccharibacteria bacterium]|nr:hypothetical protein [Candidatus Saccharibacteria bacterium]